MASLPSGTVTFVITDIVGSTSRWVAGSMEKELRLHDAATREAIEVAGGVWVKHTGDGVLAAFGDAVSAVEAAVGTHEALEAIVWDGEPLQVRIGLHTGEASPTEGDYFALAVSTTARVADTGHGGQTIVSEATHALLGPAVPTTDLGAHTLKDLGEPVRLFQVDAPGRPSSFPPLRTLGGTPNNLPAQRSSFVGRERQVDEVRDLVLSNRLVTLTGVGGAGKTRLSLQVAAEVVDRFDAGVWFVELAPLIDEDEVSPAIAEAVGARFLEGDSLDSVDRVVSHLRHASALLVLDNCEHVLDAVAGAADRVLAGCPAVRVLATSREGLGLAGEHLWHVPSLDAATEGVSLFRDRATAAGARFPDDEETQAAISSICALLDGVPLAIELAAARARSMTPVQIEERLSDRFRLLSGGRRTALPRQRTLEGAVDWSYRALDEGEASLFERLSVFQGGFTLEAAEGVCGGDDLDEGDVLGLLDGLVDKSLVEFSAEGPGRYRLLETLRLYGARKLDDRGGTGERREAHSRWFAAQTDLRHPVSGGSTTGFAWLRQEAANLTAAYEWTDDPALLAPLADGLMMHHYDIGDPATAIRLQEELLRVAPADDVRRRADAFTTRALLLGLVDRLDEMAEAVDAALAEARLAGDTAVLVRTLRRIGTTLAFNPRTDAGRGAELVREAVELAVDEPVRVRARAIAGLLWAAVWTDGPVDELERAVVDLEAIEPDGEVLAWGLAAYALATQRLDQLNGSDLTEPVEDRILDLRHQTADEAWIGLRRGDWRSASGAIETLLGEERGRFRINGLTPKAELLWMRGELEEARAVLVELDELGPTGRWHHDVFPLWAEVACQLGDLPGVEEAVERHLAVPVQPIEEPLKASTLRALVQAHVDGGRRSEAEATVARIRAMLESEPRRTNACVQLLAPETALRLAEAELSRLTGPDPEGWSGAGRHCIWEYWKVYCEARRAEALLAVGDPSGPEVRSAALRRAEESGTNWIAGWLADLG